MQPVVLHTDDGYEVQGHHFIPANPCGVTVLVSPAIFVRQRFYYAYARWLALQGVHALTYCNRGMGQSLAAETTPWQHELRHWGERDLPAAIAWAKDERPTDRLYVVGHSMGGQIVTLSDAVHQLDGIVTVAATSAYWGNWPRPHRYGILAWYGLAPVLGRALPYFPAERVRFGPNVASSLARDWVRWGRNPDYLYGTAFGLEPKTADYKGRVLAWSFTDDTFGVERAVDALHQHYSQAKMDRRHVHPRDIGVRYLGHFNWFKKRVGPPLWQQTLDWMQESMSA